MKKRRERRHFFKESKRGKERNRERQNVRERERATEKEMDGNGGDRVGRVVPLISVLQNVG